MYKANFSGVIVWFGITFSVYQLRICNRWIQF